MSSPIANRKLWQWTLGYIASAWVVLEATGEISNLLLWPRIVQLVVLILLLFGLPTAMIIAWYHGEKGAQEVTPTEVLLISLITVTGVLTVFWVARATPSALEPFGPVSGRLGGPPLDATRYAVFPFRGEEEEGVPALALTVQDALARWDGIELVDRALVGEALDPDDPAIARVQEARERSRRNGAGRLLLGDVARVGDELRVRMELRETASGRVLADTTVRLPASSTGDDEIGAVANALLFAAEGLSAPDAARPGTSSFPARVAFLEGMGRLDEWDLDGAIRRFEEAGHLDPGYARAHLWRAQAMHWGRRRGPDVLVLAERARGDPGAMGDRETRLVEGLLQLERGDYREACSTYEALRSADPSDFAAWYGLGRCHDMDGTVVRDASSPSGWSFRSSYHQAVEAYRRAFELIPTRFERFSSQAFEQAQRVLFTTAGDIRVGRTTPPDPIGFAAYATLDGDTLAFVPNTIPDFSRDEIAGAPPEAQWAAVERQRRVLRDLVAGWLGSFPSDPQVLRAYALTLDLLGDPATLDTLASARAKTDDPSLDHQLAIETVSRRVKYAAPDDLDQLAMARILADSLLRGADSLPPSAGLSAVAALTGRVYLAARLSAEVERRNPRPQLFPVDVPTTATALAAALSAYAAMGAPSDSIYRYEDLVVEVVENRVPPGERERILHSLLDRAAALAFPSNPLTQTRSLSETTDFPLLHALGAFAKGDVERARALAPGLDIDPSLSRPADKSFDVLLPESWLAVQLGDTVAAMAALDATLDALPWLEPRNLNTVEMAGAMVRAMALRADLANGMNQPEVASRWAAAVAVLWESADDPLQPVVARMRAMGRTTNGTLSPQLERGGTP